MSTIALALRIATAQQAAAADLAAIAHGTPSFTLMLRAGTLTATCILREYETELAHGVAVYAGSGNNGGDAYIVAAQLARAGVQVQLIVADAPRTDDAKRAAVLATAHTNGRLHVGRATGRERLVIDGLLGTGHRGEFRAPISAGIDELRAARARGAHVWALDIPSGLDATTGARASGLVGADVTTTYGTVKRGLLSARDVVGRLLLLDIGVSATNLPRDAWGLADSSDLASRLPPVPWNAHKGTRGTVAIVGGCNGMAGAVTLAARGALRSGAGLVRAVVEQASVPVVQHAIPQAIARAWPEGAAREGSDGGAWGHALVIGPGLGHTQSSHATLLRALELHPSVPTLLDADALNVLARDGGDVAARLREWCGARSCIITPHPGEFARLSGVPASAEWTERTEAAIAFARAAQVTVVLKGAPSSIVHADRETESVCVVPRGSSVLATGGSGDVLSGVIGALLAQRLPAFDAALLGVTAHGLAGERVATDASAVRGATLDDVIGELPHAWRSLQQPPSLGDGVLAAWPSLA